MLSAPTLLAETHDVELFRSGSDSLDKWLRRRARANQVSGASRTYVVAEGTRVVGYYCLSSGALDVAEAPGAVRRNMPDPDSDGCARKTRHRSGLARKRTGNCPSAGRGVANRSSRRNPWNPRRARARNLGRGESLLRALRVCRIAQQFNDAVLSLKPIPASLPSRGRGGARYKLPPRRRIGAGARDGDRRRLSAEGQHRANLLLGQCGDASLRQTALGRAAT